MKDNQQASRLKEMMVELNQPVSGLIEIKNMIKLARRLSRKQTEGDENSAKGDMQRIPIPSRIIRLSKDWYKMNYLLLSKSIYLFYWFIY